LEELQNLINGELGKIIDWLRANKLSLTISETNICWAQINMLTQILLK